MQRGTRTLTGVISFSIFSGIVSGFLIAASFMPVYSFYSNWRKWHPGSQELVVSGEVSGHTGSRVVHVQDWDDAREMGFPSQRLWLYNSNVAQAQEYALVAHGVWRQRRIQLGDEITLDLPEGPRHVPVAGVWHPFHPQLGDNWAVLVGSTDIPVSGDGAVEAFSAVNKPKVLPPGFQGWNMVSWLLFNGLVFILFGAIGLLDYTGRSRVLGWAAKLWLGGIVATIVGLITAIFVFRAMMPLPLLSLLPMTFGMLAFSYALSVVLLTGLCMVVARFSN